MGKNLLLCDSLLIADEKSRTFATANHERKRNLTTKIIDIDSNFTTMEIFKNCNFIHFAGKTIYLHSAKETLYTTENQIKVDFLVVRNNARQSLEEMLKIMDIGFVIIDKSNTPFYEKRWREDCQQAQIPYHSMSERGKCFQYQIQKE